MSGNDPYRILFLCTGNSARSILAEALLNHYGSSKCRGYSAGSHPTGQVHPMTLRVLRESGISPEGLRSKSWDEFTGSSAPAIDCVITVCDRAAAEPCPVWPGQPRVGHWSIADPAGVKGDATIQLDAFRETLSNVESRIQLLLTLKLNQLTTTELTEALHKIDKEVSQ